MSPYYYNTITQETTYQRPAGYKSPRDAYTTTHHDFQKTASPMIDNGAWQKAMDPSTQLPYYYNKNTQESTHFRPQNFHTPPDPPLNAPVMAITNTPWQKAIDQATMQPYYYNHETQESTYQRPVDFEVRRYAGTFVRAKVGYSHAPLPLFMLAHSLSLFLSLTHGCHP